MKITPTQEKLLHASLPLMLSKGYPATTVDEICEKAGLSKGSFYNGFPSKEALGLSLLEWYHQGGSEMIFTGSFNDLNDPMEKMFGFLDHVYGVSKKLWSSGCLLANLGLELADSNPKIRVRVSRIFQKLTKRLADVFEPAGRTNGKKGRPTAEELAEQFLITLEGAILLARVNQDWKHVKKGLRNFRNYLQILSG